MLYFFVTKPNLTKLVQSFGNMPVKLFTSNDPGPVRFLQSHLNYIINLISYLINIESIKLHHTWDLQENISFGYTTLENIVSPPDSHYARETELLDTY
jgi:hypothetical protein